MIESLGQLEEIRRACALPAEWRREEVEGECGEGSGEGVRGRGLTA